MLLKTQSEIEYVVYTLVRYCRPTGSGQVLIVASGRSLVIHSCACFIQMAIVHTDQVGMDSKAANVLLEHALKCK